MNRVLKSMQDIFMFFMFALFILYFVFDKIILVYIGVALNGIAFLVIEKIKRNIVKKNPCKVKAEIIKWKYGRYETITLQYVINNVTYKKKITGLKLMDVYDKKQIDTLKIGDIIDVYSSKEIPDFILLTCDKSKIDTVLLIGIIISFILLLIINILKYIKL